MPNGNGGKTEVNKDAQVKWTDEQRRVIDARDRSLLVSAAAGSGKTAVLVERILSLITDPVRPVDVDEILVVTFTRAAAAEMRERIRNALSAAADKRPEDKRLQSQMSLIHNAQITTIDSFCLQVVTNHFHRIGLEPGFRIADEGELILLREDALSAVLEDFYAERDPDFLRFMQGYSGAKDDDAIRKKILRLYNYAQSYPWPEEWLEGCAGQYDADSVDELEQKDWWKSYLALFSARAGNIVSQCRENLELSRDEDGPGAYVPMIANDLARAERLLHCRGIEDYKAALENFVFDRLASDRNARPDPDKVKRIQNTRKKVKDQVNAMIKDLSEDREGQLELLKKAGEMVRVFVRLVKGFSERFAQEKAERNIMDFSDGEHFALRILLDPETKQPGEVAKEYRERFREIMVDEYQDSNYLQEAILTAVSGIPEGRQNMFMVGDVKQSIYRFRRACPDLFIDKYEKFSTDENPTQRIDLHKNFRSRSEVLDIVNDLFGMIMGRDLGNIEYDEGAALYLGRKAKKAGEGCRPECIVVKREKGKDPAPAEAGAIARRIRKMVEDQEIPGIGYRDIVILLRSMKTSRSFVKAFEQEGVPLLVASRTGYFDAVEVQVLMSMLRVIDNPRQDIPLAALMRSPIGEFTDEEMALIRAKDTDAPFWECVALSAENEKVSGLLRLIADFRRRVPYTPIHVLIRQILEETGYRDLASAMPAGEQRKANLDMLIEKAAAYENTSYHGLCHFVRYVDRLIKYEADIGEAEISSEQEDTVRLMTIHKSKGLEFPVVIVAGMGNGMNLSDSKDDVIFHPNFGVGIKYCDPVLRSKKDTPIRRAFSFEAKRESLGEELRILYVAMTRAKDKLILAGKEPKNLKEADAGAGRKLSFSLRFDAESYWEWVLPALGCFGDSYPVRYEGTLEEEAEDAAHIVRTANMREELLKGLGEVDEDILSEISERFSKEYPYRPGSLKQKMSVSELKHRAMAQAAEISDEEGKELFPEEIPSPYVPRFVKEPEENLGAERGTAFHRLMECIDFSASSDPGELFDSEKARLLGTGRIEPEDAELIDRGQTLRFLETGISRRMAAAAKKGLLMREQPFVMSLRADEFPEGLVPEDADLSETVLIQGIIDAFWEEEDGLVLLDYKTDRVRTAEELIRRYKAQITLYSDALSRRFKGKRVKERIIYSFCLDRVISL